MATGYQILSQYPMPKSEGFATNRDKSKDFAEVFTPPHIVDAMLGSVPGLSSATRNIDLCAGHGQFTVRMLRKFSQEDNGFRPSKYLKDKNFFAELQLDSCYKLLWIFGTGINLAIGDALQLAKLPAGWRGIWLYIEGAGVWVNITGIVKAELPINTSANLGMFPYDSDLEGAFVKMVEGLTTWLNLVAKEPKVELDKLVNIPAGRELLKNLVRNVATDVEENWQNVKTPEWVAREMVRCIPDLKLRSKILVLFNVELVEALVKEGVDVRKITFGSDSPLEDAMIQSLYKRAKTLQVGRSLEEMKKALEGKAGQYDVVISNPPYQIMDGGFKASARPIYHEIVMYAIDELKPQYVCMITPSRWMAGGKGLDGYRARMMKDTHIRLVEHYAGASSVFPEVSVSGGVSYFVWDRDYNGLCVFDGEARNLDEFDVIVTNSKAITILRKVLRTHMGAFMDSSVSSSKPYGFREDTEESETGIACWFKQSRGKLFVDPCTIKDSRGDLCKWKVLSPRTIPGADVTKFGIAPIKAIHSTNMFVARPGEGCSESYIVLKSFKTQATADNFRQYVLTKFFRFMLLLRVVSQDVTREKFAWVPDLNDYSNPFSDADLYAHFNLTKKEMEYIESTIK